MSLFGGGNNKVQEEEEDPKAAVKQVQKPPAFGNDSAEGVAAKISYAPAQAPKVCLVQ